MRVVIAPDKLRGTYTADEAAAALARGLAGGASRATTSSRCRWPTAARGRRRRSSRARGGEWREADVHDALGRPCTARFARLIDGSAVLDVAEACGAARVADAAAATRSAPRRAAPVS